MASMNDGRAPVKPVGEPMRWFVLLHARRAAIRRSLSPRAKSESCATGREGSYTRVIGVKMLPINALTILSITLYGEYLC
jgi:hypothetical protein